MASLADGISGWLYQAGSAGEQSVFQGGYSRGLACSHPAGEVEEPIFSLIHEEAGWVWLLHIVTGMIDSQQIFIIKYKHTQKTTLFYALELGHKVNLIWLNLTKLLMYWWLHSPFTISSLFVNYHLQYNKDTMMNLTSHVNIPDQIPCSEHLFTLLVKEGLAQTLDRWDWHQFINHI